MAVWMSRAVQTTQYFVEAGNQEGEWMQYDEIRECLSASEAVELMAAFEARPDRHPDRVGRFDPQRDSKKESQWVFEPEVCGCWCEGLFFSERGGVPWSTARVEQRDSHARLDLNLWHTTS